jgi:hypothetical protein
MKNEKIQIVREILFQMTPNFYTACGHAKKLNWDQKNVIFGIFYNFCWKKASVEDLAGVFPPRPNFDGANLQEIKNPEERDQKIQNFRLKIPVFWAFENLVHGHWSIFLIIDFFEP